MGFKNGSNETPFLVAKYKDEADSDVTIYEFDANGKSRDKWENNEFDLLTALSVNYIGSITDSENHQRIYVPTFPQAPAKKISMRDDCLSKVENLLCVGRTGTGKSYALSAILGQAALYNPDARITVCDFKNSSFTQFADTPNYYGFTEVFDGIVKVYNEFFERVGAPTDERNIQAHYLLIDEYAALISYLSSKDKKKAEEVKGMVGDMLMMGRSLNIRVFVGMQRADSAHFKEGSRDQFGAILALGNLSRIQKDMLFPDDKDKMTVRNGRGQGYLLIDGQDIERVVIEAIDDFDALNAVIRQAMNH